MFGIATPWQFRQATAYVDVNPTNLLKVTPYSFAETFYIFVSKWRYRIPFPSLPQKKKKSVLETLYLLFNPKNTSSYHGEYCATRRKFAGSIPDGVMGIFQ